MISSPTRVSPNMSINRTVRRSRFAALPTSRLSVRQADSKTTLAWLQDGRARRSMKEGGVVSERRVALSRGINVGRAKRLAMGDLRALVEDLGYGEVRTLLNSGNIVFTVPSTARRNAAARIEKALASRLGVSARVTVLTAAEVVAAVRDNPLSDVTDNPSRLPVMVLADPHPPAAVRTVKYEWPRRSRHVRRQVRPAHAPSNL